MSRSQVRRSHVRQWRPDRLLQPSPEPNTEAINRLIRHCKSSNSATGPTDSTDSMNSTDSMKR